MHSDIAFGFWIKPFLILQIKCWCCAESRFSHKNTNNSRLMMQLREKINLELAVIKCFFLNPPACWVQAVLATSQGCLRCQRGCPTLLSTCTFCSWHICVCGASWPWNSHQREKNKKKKNQQPGATTLHIFQLLSEYFSSVQFAQKWHSITPKMFPLSRERHVQSETRGN